MKKVLFVASVQSHIQAFHIPYLEWFHSNGFEVHVACNHKTGYETEEQRQCKSVTISFCDVYHDIPFARSPFGKDNLQAYQQLQTLIAAERFDLIHCHTPVGGALARLAVRSVYGKAKCPAVFYTAHGFHFFKGGSLKNRLLFYPIEKYLARFTDCLITINNEDYMAACSGHFPARRIQQVNGVGVDLTRFRPVDQAEKKRLRKELGYQNDSFILIYTAELSARKNQFAAIDTAKHLISEIPQLKILLAGSGTLSETYANAIRQAGLQSCIKLLGFRNDVDKLLHISDIAFSSSRQEGLPVNLMEAMACAKPLIASDVRGNRDLVIPGENGYLFHSPEEAAKHILKLYKDPDLCLTLGQNAYIRSGNYSIEKVLAEYTSLYELFF